jgi:hypothetical protein
MKSKGASVGSLFHFALMSLVGTFRKYSLARLTSALGAKADFVNHMIGAQIGVVACSRNGRLWNGPCWLQSGRSEPWNSPLHQLAERNQESRKNGGFYRAGARCSDKQEIQRYLVFVFGTSRPSLIW